jgi:molybdenum cofactor cytidylyltransferase
MCNYNYFIIFQKRKGHDYMGNISAIILAAGMSKRMGRPKQLLSLGGKPLFRYSVDAAVSAGLKPIVLVGGKHKEELHKNVADLTEVEVIENRDYESGMASSLKIGIRALTGRTDAAVVFLGDQPFVPSVVTKKILDSYELQRKEGVRILRAEYNGTAGHPILFDADLFKEFENIQGDEGGKSIINNHHTELLIIQFGNSDWGLDIDTPKDFLKLKKIAPKYINYLGEQINENSLLYD